jgi:hypothetical protein
MIKLVTFSSTVAIAEDMFPLVAASLIPYSEFRYTPRNTTVEDVPRDWPISALEAATGIVMEHEETMNVSAEAINSVVSFFIVFLF